MQSFKKNFVHTCFGVLFSKKPYGLFLFIYQLTICSHLLKRLCNKSEIYWDVTSIQKLHLGFLPFVFTSSININIKHSFLIQLIHFSRSEKAMIITRTMVNIFLSKVISSPPSAFSSHEHLCFIVIYVVKHLHLPHSNNLTLFKVYRIMGILSVKLTTTVKMIYY